MDQRERLGLGISTAGHLLVFGVLSLGLLQGTAKINPPPATIDVSFADAIALESLTRERAPDIPQTAMAPEVGEPEPDAAPPAATPAPPPTPTPPDPVAPPPKPRAITPTPQPAPPPPATKPVPPRATPRPTPTPTPTPPAPSKTKASPTPAPPQRASRLGANFLKGIDSDTVSTRTTPNTSGANAAISPIAARALNAEITRQIKPFWRPPSGADAERLVTLLSVRLDESGRVIGSVEVIGQEGVTASNRAQADLHAERAVQAVMRASPFKNLPPEYYEQWKWLRPLRIYASLGQ